MDGPSKESHRSPTTSGNLGRSPGRGACQDVQLLPGAFPSGSACSHGWMQLGPHCPLHPLVSSTLTPGNPSSRTQPSCRCPALRGGLSAALNSWPQVAWSLCFRACVGGGSAQMRSRCDRPVPAPTPGGQCASLPAH